MIVIPTQSDSQTKLCDLSKSHTVTISSSIRKKQPMIYNSDPSLNNMYKKMTGEWESSKDDTGDRHQTKLRNQTSSEQTKPCKRSASEFEQKSRRGKLRGLLFCYGQFAFLLLLLQAVTKVLSKFFLVLILLSRCVFLTHFIAIKLANMSAPGTPKSWETWAPKYSDKFFLHFVVSDKLFSAGSLNASALMQHSH